jgi:signal-transduction protein with cAMP-binding, CBS, and nucleotidyltransferase domain
MSNVIHVEFGKKNEIQEVPGADTASSLTAYLDSLREQGVDDEDILEVIDAINDKDVYFAADEVVQQFADGWLRQFL